MACVRRTVQTPFGLMALEETEGFLTRLWFPGYGFPEMLPGSSPVLDSAEKQLQEYFAGKRREFDLPVRLTGTEFRRKVWQTLKDLVGFGTVVSYGTLAEWSGFPRAFRAVGSAMHNNPLPIIVPCHRVIAAAGKIGGFGGGLPLKKQLLALEGLSIDF